MKNSYYPSINVFVRNYLFILCFLPVFLASQSEAARIRVTDGDTIVINGEKIRISGIDTPESGQVCDEKYRGQWPCGWAATDFLKSFVEGKQITCQKVTTDKYRRTVANCYANGQDIGAAMIAEGMAVPYKIGGEKYQAAADLARKQGIGLWYGGFADPAKWRKAKKRRQIPENTYSSRPQPPYQ